MTAAKRLRPVRRPAPMPENPYRRIFTPMPTFETLARRAREAEKRQKRAAEGFGTAGGTAKQE